MFKYIEDMKKQYINPELTVVELQMTQQILAGSILSTNPTHVTPGSSDAHGFDFDEDEDEEDY